ncbi:hypothetical protein BD779DRAFT_351423 [Infundibulicybe gibba]|nr:hypothetical protein BD779DRAFT_351423 [Infundibulicybe gibba]
MDLGVLPSCILYPPGQGRRRVLASPQEPERGKIGGGDGQAQVGWIVPFSADSRQSNAYQQDSKSPEGVYNATRNLETREVSPYIFPPSPSLSSGSSGYDSHLQSFANPHHATPSSTRPPPPQENRPFHAHGWAEYLLPDESLYYVHQGYQVVADMDLNDEKRLNAVMAYLMGQCDVIPPGQELWLRDADPREGGFDPLRWLVDHSKQSVAFNPLRQTDGDGEGHRPQYGCGDDRLDARYRYWSFMESHPAHTPLPLGAHQEAMNALNWASTNRLLPPNHSAPAPFTPEECQSLTALLRSADTQRETSFRTNTVSKILLRAICRRQSHSRPDKPLPADAGRRGLHRAGHPAPVSSSALVLMAAVYACLAIIVALCLLSQTFMKIAGVGRSSFSRPLRCRISWPSYHLRRMMDPSRLM